MGVRAPRCHGAADGCLTLMRARDAFDLVALITMFGEDGNRSRSHGLTPKVVGSTAVARPVNASRQSCYPARNARTTACQTCGFS